jgi:tetratricopeptide (TPR) repeat protein
MSVGYKRASSSLERATAMAKTGRNDPCPCGSGKKYKRCCVEKDETAAAIAAAAAQTRQAAARAGTGALMEALSEQRNPYDGLVEASNAVMDMVRAGKLDEAEAAANDLLVRFPEVHDGYDRLGMVAEARGDKKLAAAYYRKVVELVRQNSDLYDPQLQANFQKWADELDPPIAT